MLYTKLPCYLHINSCYSVLLTTRIVLLRATCLISDIRVFVRTVLYQTYVSNFRHPCFVSHNLSCRTKPRGPRRPFVPWHAHNLLCTKPHYKNNVVTDVTTTIVHKTQSCLLLPFRADAGTRLFVHKTPQPALLCRGEPLCRTRKGGWMYALRGCVTWLVAVVTLLYSHYVHKVYIVHKTYIYIMPRYNADYTAVTL